MIFFFFKKGINSSPKKFISQRSIWPPFTKVTLPSYHQAVPRETIPKAGPSQLHRWSFLTLSSIALSQRESADFLRVFNILPVI